MKEAAPEYMSDNSFETTEKSGVALPEKPNRKTRTNPWVAIPKIDVDPPQKEPGLIYTREFMDILRYTREEARFLGHREADTGDLLAGMIRSGSLANLAAKYHLDINQIESIIARKLITQDNNDESDDSFASGRPKIAFNEIKEPIGLSDGVRHIIEQAEDEAKKRGRTEVIPRDLMRGLLKSGGVAGRVLRQMGVEPEMLLRKIS